MHSFNHKYSRQFFITRYLLQIILLMTFLSCNNNSIREKANNCNKYNHNYIPINLEDALNYMDCSWSEKDKIFFRGQQEKNACFNGPGMGIRNSWGLWAGKNELVQYFNNIGIFHPDDMSSIILISFHRRLNGKEINLDEQVTKYTKYWEEWDEKVNEIKEVYDELKIGEVAIIYFDLIHVYDSTSVPELCTLWPYLVEEWKEKGGEICKIEGRVIKKEKSNPVDLLFLKILKIRGAKRVKKQLNDNILMVSDTLIYEIDGSNLAKK